MNFILVNGTAASKGGALTILNSYLASKTDDDENFYYIFCPHEPEVNPKNSKWICCSTNGFSTLFFTLILSFLIAIYFKCNKIISFSNLNCLFALPSLKKVTYFQNMLILNDSSLKFKVLRFFLKYGFQKKNVFIFQTSYVFKQFVKNIGYEPVCKIFWPGVKVKAYRSTLSSSNKDCKDFRFLVPIIDISHPHKNFDYIHRFIDEDTNEYFRYFVTASIPNNDFYNDEVIKFLGKLSHDQFLEKIKFYDGLLILSETETVCLPIFEALSTNTPVFILDKGYIRGLEDEFGVIDGLYKFKDFKSLISAVELSFLDSKNYFRDEYLIGKWDF